MKHVEHTDVDDDQDDDPEFVIPADAETSKKFYCYFNNIYYEYIIEVYRKMNTIYLVIYIRLIILVDAEELRSDKTTEVTPKELEHLLAELEIDYARIKALIVRIIL